MNRPNNIARLISGLVLALVGLMIGSIVPGYCLDLPFSGPVAKTLLTSPSWFSTGNLNTARTNHTATQLQNGKVLTVGGSSGTNILESELYDPVTGMWSVTGSLNTPRGSPTATLLPDGKVLVVAGDASDSPPPYFGGTAELYDPSTGTWSLTGSLNVARCCHTATLLQSGKVLVAGGFGLDSMNSAELYDPAAGTWSKTGNLSAGRDSHTATLLPDGEVLVVGGEAWHGQYPSLQVETLGGAELYDPNIGEWTSTSSLNTARSRHTATLLPD